jgi:cell division protein FtsL
MDAFEYQIRKDIRNNPIVREVDQARVRELWQSVVVGGVFVVMLLYAAWQHFELIRYGYRTEQLQEARQNEERTNRHLRLQVQALQRPQRIEKIAKTQLHMVQPGPADAIVLERVKPNDPPDKSVVALK